MASGAVQLSGPQDSRSEVTLTMSDHEVYYSEDTVAGSSMWRSRLSQTGIIQRFAWNYAAQDWFLFANSPSLDDACGAYNLCGAYGSCNDQDSPPCGCFDGFVPAVGAKGCSRRKALVGCSSRDVFVKYSGIRLPDSRNSLFDNQSVVVQECEMQCLRNCSCMAYAQMDVGLGCLFYYSDLIDIKNMSQGGHDLYIRMDSSESGNDQIISWKILINYIIHPLIYFV